MILIFTNPILHSKNKLDFYSQYYAYPYFEQKWDLFSPPPKNNYTLIVSYNYLNEIKYLDILNEMRLKHHSQLLKGNEPVLIALVNSIHYLEQSTDFKNNINKIDETELNFKILNHLVQNYMQYFKNIKSSSFKIKLLVENTNSFSKKIYYN